jgi:plasmid stabilization system protein ParE
MHVRLSASAEADLDALAAWLVPRSAQGLARLMTAILTTLGQLEGFPLLGKPGRVDVERVLDGRQKFPPEDGSASA